jgi:NAD(P)-dependent dehydrogenase (short-subunit alcohol dehydrogenase family)
MLESADLVGVVTGSGAGIGRATAVALASTGVPTVVLDLNVGTGDETVREMEASGGRGWAMSADVTDEQAVERAVATIEQQYGPIGFLVNNAGGVPVDRDGRNLVRDDPASPGEGTLLTEDIPLSEWRLMLDLNLTSQFIVTHAVLPLMRQRRFGRIVAISSTAARSIGSAAGAHYTAAKAGVISLARHVASEMAPFGITVNAVCPGPVLTTKIGGAIGSLAEARQAEIPIGRWLVPDDLARAIVFLLSPASGAITGAVLDVDGGILLGRADIGFVNDLRRVAWGDRLASAEVEIQNR